MSEFAYSAETNSNAPPDTDRLRTIMTVGNRVITLPEDFVGPLRPDTPEEAETRAKEMARARLDFQLAWDVSTAEIEARKMAEAPASPVTHIHTKRRLGHLAIHHPIWQRAS